MTVDLPLVYFTVVPSEYMRIVRIVLLAMGRVMDAVVGLRMWRKSFLPHCVDTPHSLGAIIPARVP